MANCPAIYAPPYFCGPKKKLNLRRVHSIIALSFRFSLQCEAAKAFEKVLRDCKKLNIKVEFTSGSLSAGRTCATQKSIIERICHGDCASGCPGLAAPCGRSAHNLFLALDVKARKNHQETKFVHVMKVNGFNHPNLPSDPYHWSYKIDR
jgi:hypothetical protein